MGLKLRLVTAHCPGHEGCKCRECLGLREYMVGLTGRDHGLPAARSAPSAPEPLSLRVVEACTGKLTCECPGCADERQALVKRGSRGTRQPWQSRKAA